MKEKIIVPKSAYHKEPFTEKMRLAHAANSYGGRRDAAVIAEGAEDYLAFARERWAESTNRERTGDEWHDDC